MPIENWSTADVAMLQRRRLEMPLGWLIFLAAGSFFFAQMAVSFLDRAQLPVVHYLGLLVALGINGWAMLRRREVFVQRWLVNIGVLVATAVLVFDVFFTDRLLILALGRYVMLVLICKLLEKKGNRDYTQMVLLSLMLMITASVINDGPWLLMVAVFWMFLGSYTAMVLVLKTGLDRVAKEKLSSESAPLDARKIARNTARGWPGRALLGRTIGAVTVLLLAGVGMFIVAPRLEIGTGDLFDSQALREDPDSITGFSSEILLGRKQRIYESDVVVGRMRMENRHGASPGLEATYLRGMVFDSFSNGRWSQSSHEYRPYPSPVSMLLGSYTQEVEMDRTLLPHVFLSYPAISVQSPDGQVVLGPSFLPKLRANRSRQAPVTYKAVIWDRPLDLKRRRYLGQVRSKWPQPANVKVTPRVRSLARQWCRDLMEMPIRDQEDLGRRNLAIARRIAERLKQRCTYTLDLNNVDPQADALEDFLFSTRSGHCEYFASAHVAMCSSLGVPSRLVAGFLVSPPPEEQWTLIRESDAHAWSEVYTTAMDWQIIDATPPSTEDLDGDDFMAGALRWWESVEYWWNRNVLSFDENSRDRLAAWVFLAGGGFFDRIEGFFLSVWDVIRGALRGGIEDIILSLIGAIVLFATPFLLRWGYRFLKSRHVVRKPWQRSYRNLPRFLVDLLGLLERYDLHWEPRQTLEEIAQKAQAELAIPTDDFRELTDLYYRWRWSEHEVSSQQLRQARNQVRSLREQMAQAQAQKSD